MHTRRKMSAATTRMYEILSDGGWHVYDEVIEKIAPLVPAAVAYERRERYRKRGAINRGRYQTPESVPKSSLSYIEIVRLGQRDIARSAIIGSPHVAIEVRDGVKMMKYRRNAKVNRTYKPGPGRPLSPVTAKIYEILSDGRWHDGEKVVIEAGREISPQKAYRHREAQRLNQARQEARRRGHPMPENIVRPIGDDLDRHIATGRRDLVRRLLRQSRRIEQRRDPEHGWQLRMRNAKGVDKRNPAA